MGEAAGAPPHGAADGLALDLGTGAGLPGLVLAMSWAASRWVLLDSRRRSVAFVTETVERLGLGGRVDVVLGRAEELGRQVEHRGRYALVTARGFGPPAVTAECGAPFLRVGGRLVVSEPPGSAGRRWPEDALEQLGLRLRNVLGKDGGTFAVLEQVVACPSRFPRRSGVPAKRPLFPNLEVDVSRETNAVLDREGQASEHRRQ